MTKIVNRTLIVEPEPDSICELCGTTAECRPYGPNGESICFPCGMENIETTVSAYTKVLDQVDVVQKHKGETK